MHLLIKLICIKKIINDTLITDNFELFQRGLNNQGELRGNGNISGERVEAAEKTQENTRQGNSQGENFNMNPLLEVMTGILQQNAGILAMLTQQKSERGQDTTRNFNVMPDLSKSIDVFNAENGPKQAKDWLKQLETTATLHDWPDSFTYETARSHYLQLTI